jgi:hypothetical protein
VNTLRAHTVRPPVIHSLPVACEHHNRDVVEIVDSHRWCCACGSLWFTRGGWLPVEHERRKYCVDCGSRHAPTARCPEGSAL